MQTNMMAARAGAALHNNPLAIVKIFFYVAIIIVIIFLVYRLIKGLSGMFDSIGGTSEEDKQDILTSKSYQDAQNWFDPVYGITRIVKAGYKKPSDYQLKKNITDSMLNRTAEQVFDAKTGPYANTAEVQSAIAGLPTRAAISLMALRYNYIYGPRSYPLKTFISKHLSVTEVDTLSKIIAKKPEL